MRSCHVVRDDGDGPQFALVGGEAAPLLGCGTLQERNQLIVGHGELLVHLRMGACEKFGWNRRHRQSWSERLMPD
jgi:hypothetical protein